MWFSSPARRSLYPSVGRLNPRANDISPAACREASPRICAPNARADSRHSAGFLQRNSARVGSHHGADLPGNELEIAVTEFHGLCAFAGCDRQHLPENLFTLVGDRHAVDDVAAIDVHVVAHGAKNL